MTARDSQLPAVLVNPPWRAAPASAGRKAQPKGPPLAVVSYPESMRWERGEKKKWAEITMNYGGTLSQWLGQWQLPKSLLKVRDEKRLREAIGDWDPGWTQVHVEQLLKLPAPLALVMLEVAPVKLWYFWRQTERQIAARYELRALTGLLRVAQAKPTKLFGALLPYRSPRVAPLAAHLFADVEKARPVARAWLLRHAECAATALVAPAAGPRGAESAAATAALRMLAAEGHAATVAKAAARYGAGAAAAVTTALGREARDDAPVKVPVLPKFWTAAARRPPLLAKSRQPLPPDAMQAFGELLALSPLDPPHKGIAEVRAACDGASLARFAGELFAAWLQAGAPAREIWAFRAMGHFGDDDSARTIVPLVRAWPGQSAHARAVVGLDVLGAIGSDFALMQLDRIAQKLKFKALQDRARERVAAIAAKRGLGPDELGDRLVPDFGIGPGGAVPAAFKKEAAAVGREQALRLERAMCAQRRWDREAFQRFLADHPFMRQLARRLVWSVQGPRDRLTATFRIDEEGGFVDADDRAVKVTGDGVRIGLPHRLALGDELDRRWGAVFADYEIAQPFVQLGRDVHEISKGERRARSFDRMRDRTVPTRAVLRLESRGWRRGPVLDNGYVQWMWKPVPGGQEIQLALDGFNIERPTSTPTQKLGRASVLRIAPGARPGQTGAWQARASVAPLGKLDPISFSELAADLAALGA